MIAHLNRSLLALAAATLGLGACDALTDDGYPGEALFALSGKIANNRTATPSDVRLYLVWGSPDDKPNVTTELEIEPKFPATFRIDVFTVPRVQRVVWEGHPYPELWSRGVNGHFIAATPDAEFTAIIPFPTGYKGPGVLGADPRHMIYYLPDGVAEGSVSAGVLHGVYEPGFHLIEIKCIGPAKRAEIEACLAQYRADGRPEELAPMLHACGSVNPNIPWLQRAPADLETELTVELIDNLFDYKPDPSECL